MTQAEEILSKIQQGEPVEYDYVVIEGDLDLSKLDLPTKHVERSKYEIEKLGLSETVMVVTSPINITNSTINGNVYFPNAIFHETVVFSGTIFSGYAHFGGSQFSGSYADFWGSQFSGGYANFWGAQFSGPVYFIEAQFSDSANFIKTQFSDSANFSGAQFSDSADFIGAQFSDSANFSGAQFSDSANFRDAQFNGDADFGDAQFSGSYTNFWGAHFSGTANFREAQFSDYANFREAQFSGNANFRDAQFSRNAYFQSASFSKLLRLENSKIYSMNLDAKFEKGSTISLKHSDFFRLELPWGSIKDKLDYDGSAYLALVKNFKNLEWFDDADDCYYQYRMTRRDTLGTKAKLLDYIAWIAYGYGTRPQNPLILGAGLFLFSAAFFYLDQKDSVIDALYLSASVFISNPEVHTLTGFSRFWAVLERLSGWLIMAAFLVILARKTVK